MSRFSTVIFDMDGLLVNSEEFWLECDVRFFEKRNIPLQANLKKILAGNSVKEGSAWLKKTYNLPESVEEIVEERECMTEEIYTRHASVMPGVEQLLISLQEAGIHMGIASGSSLNRIQTIVERFDWKKYFISLVSSDHVHYVGKPAPDIYEYAAQDMAADPSQCLVFEDSYNGVISAKAANMSCVAVPAYGYRENDYEDADLIVPSLETDDVYTYIGISKI